MNSSWNVLASTTSSYIRNPRLVHITHIAYQSYLNLRLVHITYIAYQSFLNLRLVHITHIVYQSYSNLRLVHITHIAYQSYLNLRLVHTSYHSHCIPIVSKSKSPGNTAEHSGATEAVHKIRVRGADPAVLPE